MTSDQHQYAISDHRMTSALRCHDQRSTTICDQISALGFGTGFHVLGFGFHNHYLLVYGSHYLLIAGCIMMISIGFNAAVSVRVSNELGAGHDKSAAFSVAVVNLVSFILYLIAAIVVLALRNVISYAFTDGETVARAMSELCPLLAFSLILNGIQPVLSGVAVGCGWQAFVAYMNVGCYYIVGIPLGLLLGFHLKFGSKGI